MEQIESFQSLGLAETSLKEITKDIFWIDKPYVMKKNNTIIATLLKTGTSGIVDEETVDRISIINLIGLIVFVSILIIGAAILYYLGWKAALIWPLITELILTMAIFPLQNKRKYPAARFVLYLTQCLAIGYFGILLKGFLRLEYVIILLIAISFLLFKEKKNRLIALVFALGDLFMLEIFYYLDGKKKDPTAGYNAAFLIHALLLSAIVFLTILVYRRVFKRSDQSFQLKRVKEIMDSYVKEITHDLKQPLNTILQATDCIKQEISDKVQVENVYVLNEMVHAATVNGRNLLGNLIDLSMIESGTIGSIKKEAFLLHPFLTRLIALNNLLAEKNKVSIKLIIHDMPAIIVSDSFILHQITTNLLSNAIKYGKKGGLITVRAQNYQRAGRDEWELQVINEGKGITKDKLEAIFEPYVSTRSATTDGTGLGLYIVKTKAIALGGGVKVESDPGALTKFIVKLPLKEGYTKDLSRQEREVLSKIDIRGLHIFVVDDDKIFGESMHYLLGKCHHCSVTVIPSGEKLFELLEQNLPDIITCDYKLPGISGPEIIRRLKGNPSFSHIPILAFTAGTHRDEVKEMIKEGAETSFTKDNDSDNLLYALQQCAAKIRLQVQAN